MLLEKNKKEAGVYPFEYFILTYPGLSLFRFTSRKSKSGSKLWSMKYKASALTTRPSPRSRNCLINVMGSKRSLNCSKEVITIFVLFKDGPSAGRPGRPKSRLLQSRKGQKFGRLVRNLQEIKGRTQEGLRKEIEREKVFYVYVSERECECIFKSADPVLFFVYFQSFQPNITISQQINMKMSI